MRRDEFPIVDKYLQKQVNDVLDKIRAEIKSLPMYGAKFTDCVALHVDRHSVLQIIDKYKAEIEGNGMNDETK